MKSTLNIEAQAAVRHTFPALYKATTSPIVVLASDNSTGTVVVCRGGLSIGTNHSGWIGFDDESAWQRLPSGSSVTLTQE